MVQVVKENLKRKKRHDKDKYYHLAKEQGYRSRAAFKLIQINRKYDFLSHARVCIDLCAAPGGWCQVAAKHMPSDSLVIGVDLLPIRGIPNVRTFVQDITTAECRALLKRELKNRPADVVLCDGAPNVGTAYNKDAFVQNEIALAALRVATHHLGRGGTFLTKVYRSSDYNALMWVFNQLFETVQAVKPSSSRQQSAEIFVLCMKYRAPDAIDPKLLDPAHVFQELETGKSGVTIFHAQYDKQKRNRSGYDPTLGMVLHKSSTVSEFIDDDDPIQFLTDYQAISFSDRCQPYLEHKLTTEEIKLCLKDLRVLGKSDFKALIKWRLKMREYKDSLLKASKAQGDGKEEEQAEEAAAVKPLTPEEEEELIQKEIQDLQFKTAAEKKRFKKKLREKMAKIRTRQALGMHHQAFDLPEQETAFTLKAIGSEKDLEEIREGHFVDVPEGEGSDDDLPPHPHDSDSDDEDEDDDGVKALENELEEAYQTYLANKSEDGLKGTRLAKRRKLAKAAMASAQAAEDAALYDGDMKGYVELLTTGQRKSKKGQEGEDEDEDEDSDTDSEEEDVSGSDGSDEEDEARGKRHPLLRDAKDLAPEKRSTQVARWFSNPVFKGMDLDELEGEEEDDDGARGEGHDDDEDSFVMEGDDMEEEEEEEEKVMVKGRGKRKKDAESDEEEADVVKEVLASLPKTDKQLRHEKRKKLQERKERRQAKKLKKNEKEAEGGEESLGGLDVGGEMDLSEMDPAQKEVILRKRALIRAGMGSTLDVEEVFGKDEGFEIVPADGDSSFPPVMDPRKYDSENEEWDDEERAQTLAIGTMMLRRSKAKQLVDASYNRFAWNDPGALPEWFLDDEEKHYRPQIPIPKPLLDEMKEKFKSLASKPIAKVAEARARKRKRAVQKLKAAKARASAIASNPDMTEKEKLRAIGKALKSKGEELARPGKVYAVVTKGGQKTVSKKGQKGNSRVKLVDKRMKKDARGMAKKKKGKRGKK